MVDPDWNHNGATNAIAGIVNERGNVLGMMPHPENHVEAAMGRTDGRGLFAGLADHLSKQREPRHPGIVPGSRVLHAQIKTWTAEASPAMTDEIDLIAD